MAGVELNTVSVSWADNSYTSVVVAIDLGTTYSGYSFSFGQNPSQIYTNQIWRNTNYHLASIKTPTCLLLNKKTEVFSFGYDAENDFADMITDKEETDDYLYFDRFKMKLHSEKDISEKMMIYDIRGEGLPAIDVFSKAIKALKEHFWTNHVEGKLNSIAMNDIKWVLTVPAMWSDKSKMFMRRCAEKAGLQSEKLSIALEPECASIYCQQPHRGTDGVLRQPTVIKQGSSYLVIDIGGGSVDIVAHQKIVHNKVKELCPASGNACGGTDVDNAFFDIMEKIVGKDVMNMFKKEHVLNYLDLVRAFEVVKRDVGGREKPKINMSIPMSTLNQLCQRFHRKSFSDVVQGSEYKAEISVKADKLQMNITFAKFLFKSTINKIMKAITKSLGEVDETLNNFLVVGGLSESSIVRDAIKQTFPDKHIISPEQPTLAVVQGAVLYGHIPNFITSRVTRFAYGRRILPVFKEGQHDIDRRVKIDEEYRCKNVFERFMKKKEHCKVGTVVKVAYHTITKKQAIVNVAVFVAENDDTIYVDDEGCEQLGEMLVDIPNPSDDRQFVDVEFQFGGTELVVSAIVRGETKQNKTKFQLI